MYLFIFEDGEVKKSSQFSEDDENSCDMGILEVVDISGDEPLQYYRDAWHPLDSCDEPEGDQ